MRNKKGGLLGSIIVFLIMIYIILGIYYHLTKNPGGSWVLDLLSGGFKMLKLAFAK